jgi:hypothetical protein
MQWIESLQQRTKKHEDFVGGRAATIGQAPQQMQIRIGFAQTHERGKDGALSWTVVG